jgi:DNA-directed RNA polymerase subunit beta
MISTGKTTHAVRDGKIQEVPTEEVDYHMSSPNNMFGSHIGLIPLQSAVQGPRLFYGARFYNQAMPVKNNEVPWVQNKPDDSEQSFDEIMGDHAGNLRAPSDGVISKVTADHIHVKGATGEEHKVPLYNHFSFNRKTQIHSKPVVQPGTAVKVGDLLAGSNYTDTKGALALGQNARVALVPYKGFSMDDAVVLSEAFAKRLTSEHLYNFEQEYDKDLKGGRNHYVSLFPQRFTTAQLKGLDDDGVVQKGTVLKHGDPMILATKPRSISSASAQLGKLSKTLRDARADSAQKWDHDEDGVVTDVVKKESGAQIYVQTYQPTKVGDKIVLRSGQKGVISRILPTDHVPRTSDGRPVDVLLNSLGIPSRVNSSLIYELLLGKVAEKNGKPYKLNSFNKPGEKWFDMVKQELDKAGMKDTEELFDPVMNKKLDRPVTVGSGYVLKLHHTAESKSSARGVGAYDANQQPAKGSGEQAQSKRLSGLETGSLLSSGAYANLREGSTLRGQRNDEYWRTLRSGYRPRPPGSPFVFDKFHALLAGAGIRVKQHDKGVQRLGPFTDKDLDDKKPHEVQNGELVDLNTLEPTKGGLFDPTMVAGNKWGRVRLPIPVPNPAFEGHLMKLLGLTERELRAVMSGDMELPEHLR